MNRIAMTSALILAGASAHAQTPQYSVATNNTDILGCSIQNSPTPVEVLHCINRGGCAGTTTDYGDCSASAQPHSVWARLEQTRRYWMNSCGGGWRSDASANQKIAVTFSGPGSSIQVRPRIAYEAVWTFSASVSNPHGGASLFIPSWTGDGSTAMSPGIGLSYDFTAGLFVNNPIGATIEQIGPLTWRATGIYVGRPANVLVGVPVEFWLGVAPTMHNGDYNYPDVISTTVTLEAIAHLSDVEAFELPPGYTVNAPEYNIVNNQWVDPRPARVTSDPDDVAACWRGTATFSVTGEGEGPLSYQWRKDTVPLSDGVSPDGSIISGALTGTLIVTGAAGSDAGVYDCVVSNDFGTATSGTATLTVCVGDFDCDGTVDFFDYDAFVVCFEGGACPAGKTADFDGDGTVDFFDYDAFVPAFEVGC